jgi:hypothetical protein
MRTRKRKRRKRIRTTDRMGKTNFLGKTRRKKHF